MQEPDVGRGGGCRGSQDRLRFGQKGREKGKTTWKSAGREGGKRCMASADQHQPPRESHHALKMARRRTKTPFEVFSNVAVVYCGFLYFLLTPGCLEISIQTLFSTPRHGTH